MKKLALLLLLTIVTISCTEPYALQTNTFEDVLVIEATITNELKKQEIKVSRTIQLEDKEPKIENGATIYIKDDLGNQFNFLETNGTYISEFEFQAFPDRNYQLFVKTTNGKQYTSTIEKLATINNLISVEATVKNKFGVNGVDITANSFDPTGTSKYYRFEYEETYRFSVPLWSNDSLVVVGLQEPFDFYLNERTTESKTCYKTVIPTEILVENTTKFAEDRLADYSLRFIDQNDYIIADRYSILVRQYIQNLAAHTFYNTLKNISGSGNVLSPSQPGFINGNITSLDNANEKVIGFFDVTSVSEKRIFFNYVDLFPGEPQPPYFYDCEVLTFDRTKFKTPQGGSYPDGNKALATLTRSNRIILYREEDPIYKMVAPECGDCRTIGSNKVPDFWE